MRLTHKAVLCLFLCVICLCPCAGLAAELTFVNKTGSGIINILVDPEDGKPFYMRLDLLPQSTDKVENPGKKSTMRVDTGLQFWFYPEMDLEKIKTLIFCPQPAGCMEQVFLNGKHLHVQGEIQNLAPEKGDKPVCNLDYFRPAMPMKDVCKILPDSLTDDNGALLTGLGFANMVWAARLVPEHAGAVTPTSLLEHLELRLPLTREHVNELLQTMKKQNFVPWQAEFPGQDLEFRDRTREEKEKSYKTLKERIIKFLDSFLPEKHQHDRNKSCEQAVVLMVPADNLEVLQNADEPQRDVQVFTIYMRPCINTLLLDVAAYRSTTSSR